MLLSNSKETGFQWGLFLVEAGEANTMEATIHRAPIECDTKNMIESSVFFSFCVHRNKDPMANG